MDFSDIEITALCFNNKKTKSIWSFSLWFLIRSIWQRHSRRNNLSFKIESNFTQISFLRSHLLDNYASREHRCNVSYIFFYRINLLVLRQIIENQQLTVTDVILWMPTFILDPQIIKTRVKVRFVIVSNYNKKSSQNI